MELGYTGVAYYRPIKGVISDTDRCSISLFTLSSLLKATPALSAVVVTIAVDNAISAAALNSAKPVLKTADLIATPLLNQMAFNQTCTKCLRCILLMKNCFFFFSI
ncbi:hypothetical protein QJS04_geneDACA012901 [Acorus gramineus]|uniref:Uncharacterized protein n=1 Tax=Acorus gramineus TaxID=55184 RepID=A0AAV9BI79_ACOGR|nr:hypothetical protein QJS04_geneDACA012901 [Acorus gramineus]